MIAISALFNGTAVRLVTFTSMLSFKNRIEPGALPTGLRPVPKYPMISFEFSSARDVAGNPIAAQRIYIPASSTMLKIRFSDSDCAHCISDNSDTTPRIVMRNGAIILDFTEINCVTHIGGSGGGSNVLPRYGDVGFADVVTVVPVRDPAGGVE